MPEVPAYQRIAAHVREQITSGELLPGARLPSIQTLRISHQVSTTTVRRALEVLADEGMITRLPGSGHYVRDRAGDDWRAGLEQRLEALERWRADVERRD